MNRKHYPLIRTIYLYLFTLVGLTLLIIGSVRFLDMGLKAFVFTQAEEEEQLYSRQPVAPYPLERIEEIQGSQSLSEEEKTAIRQWLADYKNWQEKSSKVNSVTARRHRDASFNLSMILIGLPLYLFHWRIIKRETKNKKEI